MKPASPESLKGLANTPAQAHILGEDEVEKLTAEEEAEEDDGTAETEEAPA